MRFLKDELQYLFSGKGMPYEKVSLMIAIVITLVFWAVLSNHHVEDAKVAVIDLDNSKFSHEFIEQLNASPYIEVKTVLNVPADPEKLLYQDRYLAAVYIPAGFEKNRYDKSENNIGVFYDNITAAPTGTLKSALNTIVAVENSMIAGPEVEALGVSGQQAAGLISNISLKERLLFNPTDSSNNSTVVGFLFFFSAMFFVFATIGMMARLRLERKWRKQILKGTPFDLMLRFAPYCFCLFVSLFVGLGLLRLIGDLSFAGNFFSLMFAVLLFVWSMAFSCILFGWGAPNPGAAISKMILFVPGGFILGGYTMPLDILPEWVRLVSNIFPLTWVFRFTRDILLRGASFMDAAQEFGSYMMYVAVLALLVCIRFYREHNSLRRQMAAAGQEEAA